MHADSYLLLVASSSSLTLASYSSYYSVDSEYSSIYLIQYE
jgi:hypothetical protein